MGLRGWLGGEAPILVLCATDLGNCISCSQKGALLENVEFHERIIISSNTGVNINI